MKVEYSLLTWTRSRGKAGKLGLCFSESHPNPDWMNILTLAHFAQARSTHYIPAKARE